jgi:hypothetical protein
VALRSALEDFEVATLGAISGVLAKLHYLAGLHDGRGNYAHWGMGRVHGEEAARRAIRTSHAGVVNKVLRTPLRELLEDLRCSASGLHVPEGHFLSALKSSRQRLLPERSQLASEKHLMAVLHALSALAENQESANPRGAAPPPPLAR